MVSSLRKLQPETARVMLGGHTLSLDAQLGHENVRSLDGKPIVVDKGASEGDRGGKSDREHDRANGLLRLSGFTTQSMRASDAKDIMSQAAKNEGVEDGLVTTYKQG
ncbi:hypothetical protein GQ607_015902 [Colletotrichum asianum]|uniref:Uncharacterized protein n=1 Tax=Colletotrichum asianum TaxID=702518 RepID=A0A8H3VWS6_9PEZI|nr:hypothetical protein GQ607_015902 [Colletotrichum asianum]